MTSVGMTHYIEFNNELLYNIDGANGLANLEFASVKEFKNAVTQGQLAEWQKIVIATAFPKDENGKILSCDFDHLYQPALPQGWKTECVYWGGESYSFGIASNQSFGFIHYYPETQYQSIYHEEFTDYFDRDTIRVTKIEKIENDTETKTYYSTVAGDMMQVRYTLSNETASITVDKTYRLKMIDETLPCSSDVPSNITLYCEYGSIYYVVDLFDLCEDLKDSMLFNFTMSLFLDK